MAEKIVGKKADIITFLQGLNIDKDIVWDLSIHREKRSLDSNKYFHKLCDELRKELGISMARCKNHLITDYGQIFYLEDGSPMIYKTNAPEDFMLEQETLHAKCVRITEENGKPVYFYRIYRGSSTYNTLEMHKLIQGTIQECQQFGIETASPNEIAHMQALWEQRHGKE